MRAAPLLASAAVDLDPFRTWSATLQRRGCALVVSEELAGPPLPLYIILTLAQTAWVAGPLSWARS
eukprot:13043062-Alexandrium_andersonii.AAC.1